MRWKNFSKKWKNISIALAFPNDSIFALLAAQANSAISNQIAH